MNFLVFTLKSSKRQNFCYKYTNDLHKNRYDSVSLLKKESNYFITDNIKFSDTFSNFV